MCSVDLTGQRFGRLLVLREVEPVIRTYPGRRVHKTRRVLCRCECGGEGTFDFGHLRQGRSLSCGCLRREVTAERWTKHGGAKGRTRTPEYICWKAMIARCANPQNQDFKHYGGRGISVCDRWRNDFSAFLADMGPRPEGMTLDRQDNDGDYEPGNVRWATRKQQRSNQRRPSEIRRENSQP